MTGTQLESTAKQVVRYAIEMDIGGAFERFPEDDLYDTREEAEQAIKDHICDCINAVEGGEMDDSPDPSSFRVIEVLTARNKHGVYTEYQTEVVAQRGRSKAEVDITQCDDGLYRFAIGYSLSTQGMGGPITDRCPGYNTYAEAKTAGITELLKEFPEPREYEPESVQAEVKDMRRLIEKLIEQPSLF